jgi:hypothetical protein
MIAALEGRGGMPVLKSGRRVEGIVRKELAFKPSPAMSLP